MQSKRSFFNPTLFRKNLTRTWPLWGGLSLAGSMLPLYLLLALLNQRSWVSVDAGDFARMLYEAVTTFGPALAAGYAVLCAMLVWSYLFNARSVGLLHTLPIDRTALFVTNAASGMTMLLIPYAVVGGLLCVIALCFGFFAPAAVANTIAAVLLLNLLFFGLATVCAMVTGNLFAMPALYLVVNFAAPALDALVHALSQEYLVGLVGGEISPVSRALSPLFQIYTSFRIHYQREPAALQGLLVVTVYGLVGAALLGLGWVLYRARRSESAGDVAAFRWMRPVFRFGLAVVSGLTLGWLLYALLWGELFQTSRFADLVPMSLCMALTGILGYFVASMLLEKSLRVFHKKSLPGALVVCALAVVFNLGLRFDVAGQERRVPDQGDVEWLVSYGTSDMDLVSRAGRGDGRVAKLLELHGAIVEEMDAVRDFENRWRTDWQEMDRQYDRGYITLEYHLKNGDRLVRSYNLPIAFDWAASPEAYDDLFVNFCNDPEILMERILPSDKTLELDSIFLGIRGLEKNLDTAQSQVVYEALQRDFRLGNFPGYDPMENYPRDLPADTVEYTRFNLEMNFARREIMEDGTPAAVDIEWRNINLQPTMTETIAALVDTGAVEAAWMEEWLQGVPSEKWGDK